MTIDFGDIKKYNPDRGFGFVSRTFLKTNKEIFFHIKKIKKEHPELANKLDNSETFENINFWYEVERTEKGEQVSQLWLSADNIPQSYKHELYDLTQKVESIWKNIDSPKPSWLDRVTIELVGVNRTSELNIERNNLESQRKAAEEEQRRVAEAARLKQIEARREKERQEAKRQEQMRIAKENEIRRLGEDYDLEESEARELYQLLTEMCPLNFTHSKQLSNYIVQHKLGYKYPNISGIVRMEAAGREWDFHGGFPTSIYRIICQELNLDNQRTPARPIRFTPFKDVL
ncbi:Cold-shock protein DNA-binding protein [Halothece sp. PCC 7418]|uniref:cold-shock protein n=1 Tax=Halothece sp. (strain PCC 7418) TaxID=65093 RepID=UPI0002A06E65|nr:cold shock domain-containing protein [Halothece sp. PCC 7418]AFZ42827.1 Cold-shock protein DNA-binding protein [Halothece sp. PCC 7418]